MSWLGIGLVTTNYRPSVGASVSSLSPPSLTPSVSWDGTASSGFSTVPSDPARSTAKPMCRLLEPDWQHFINECTIGVSAWALNGDTLIGGIDRVRFRLEGSTVDVLQPTYREFENADGSPYFVLGYWVTIKRPESGTEIGDLNLYAEAIPADANMQSRVIGPFHYSIVDDLYPLDVTVAPSQPVITGERYKTIQAAWDYVTTNSDHFGRVTIVEEGTYEGLKVGGLPYDVAPEGRVVLEATEPVTIGFANFTGDDAEEYDCRHPMWARGPNITFDMANITHFEHENRPGRAIWFDRVKFIDTAGGIHRKGARSTPGITEGPAWFTGCDVRACYQPYRNAYLLRGGETIGGAGDTMPEVACSVAHKVHDWNNNPFWQERSALTVTGPAGATLSLSNGNNTISRTLTAKVSGSTVGTFTIRGDDSDFLADTSYTVENVVAWLDGLTGWTATGTDAEHPRRANLLGIAGGKGAAFTDQDTSGGLTLVTTLDIHSDLIAYNQIAENIIHHNLTAWNMQSQLLWLTHPSGLRDVALVNVAAHNNTANLPAGYTHYLSQFSRSHSHVVVAHCSLPNQEILLRVNNAGNYNPDAYSAIINCAVQGIAWSGSPDVDLTIADNVIDAGGADPSGATGTVIAGTAANKFVNPSAGDFAPSGDLTNNAKAPVVDRDLKRSIRSVTAAVGAVK